MKHHKLIKVRGFHCDSYGHVNHARYVEFLEEARWQFLEDGLDLAYWRDRGLGFVIASLTINYRRPGLVGQVLDIQSKMKHLGGKSGVIRQEVVDSETGKMIVDADVTFVVLNLETGKPHPIAGPIKEGFDLVEEGLRKKAEAGAE
jgi:thioesterase-3